jgi:NAD(P)-dependent dehydrogenase (short-subunit alcohol dehydrogenase family)
LASPGCSGILTEGRESRQARCPTEGSIGRAITVALAQAGADVAVNYRTREEAAREPAGLVTALGRRCLVVPADEVADVAVMLATNGYVTGQTINVNGGWYMT